MFRMEKSAILSAIISSIYHVQWSVVPSITRPIRWTFFRSIVCVVESVMTYQLSLFSILYFVHFVHFLDGSANNQKAIWSAGTRCNGISKRNKSIVHLLISSGLCLSSTAVQCLIAFKYQKENVKYGYFLVIFPINDTKNELPWESTMKIEIGSNISSQGWMVQKKVTKWMNFSETNSNIQPHCTASWVCILEFVTFEGIELDYSAVRWKPKKLSMMKWSSTSSIMIGCNNKQTK